MPHRDRLYRRHLMPAVEAALEDAPVVMVVRPRQAGKTPHFRTHAGREIDLVLEADDGRPVGIEVKSAAGV